MPTALLPRVCKAIHRASEFVGLRMANTPKLKKAAAISSAAGASPRLGIVPRLSSKNKKCEQ